MANPFTEILAQVRRGETAQLRVELEGQCCTRLFQPQQRLILLGGGHVSQQLCPLGAMLGYRVIVMDDRPDFATAARFPQAAETLCDGYAPAIAALHITQQDSVAILTRGHRYDGECLRALLSGPAPRYLGMIGSRRRVSELFRQLEAEGYSKEGLAAIHAPIGLSINAQTPQEIAISIAAQLVQLRREGFARRGHSALLMNQDIDLPLLEFLGEDPAPKAAVLVCDTSGSTPAKSGALMAVDQLGHIAGTIGGGCWENEAALAARRLIGTGGRQALSVELDDDIAAGEGMACGGRMRVLAWDVTAH